MVCLEVFPIIFKRLFLTERVVLSDNPILPGLLGSIQASQQWVTVDSHQQGEKQVLKNTPSRSSSDDQASS